MNARQAAQYPRIDQFALDTERPHSEYRSKKHHADLNAGRTCGWRSLAAAVLVRGIQRARAAVPHHEATWQGDTVEDARRFVLSPWARYLAHLCDMDMELVQEHVAEWEQEWEAEEAGHDKLPTSLVPDWYKKGAGA